MSANPPTPGDVSGWKWITFLHRDDADEVAVALRFDAHDAEILGAEPEGLRCHGHRLTDLDIISGATGIPYARPASGPGNHGMEGINEPGEAPGAERLAGHRRSGTHGRLGSCELFL